MAKRLSTNTKNKTSRSRKTKKRLEIKKERLALQSTKKGRRGGVIRKSTVKIAVKPVAKAEVKKIIKPEEKKEVKKEVKKDVVAKAK